MNIKIIDYDMGNVHSVQNALTFLGYESSLAVDASSIHEADCLILPGVGAFEDGMVSLHKKKMIEPLKEAFVRGKKILGICLGMQLLLDKSYEMGEHVGLGFIKGEVTRFSFDSEGLKIPHMGWNSLDISKKDPIFENLPETPYVYFVHSYHVKITDESLILATTHYGKPFCSAFKSGQTYGLQFHPEKSQEVGLKILKNFLENT
ncbi:imidazole glycerol phosphate synthase, glutamine amidotransferase subunit [PVC group bacterium (ex Bugula neritina AB1)]|nr:imidazole glycerol phosphate synthase, glutamine amidotransferase subunit [PVC group bacterium (ex Bugula neritina AB1)]